MSTNPSPNYKAFTPDKEYLTFHWKDLEVALWTIANPSKQSLVTEIIQSILLIQQANGPEKAAYTLVMATAWLTSDEHEAD